MKTGILILFCLFSTIGLAQLTPKEKGKPQQEVTSTSDTCKVTVAIDTPPTTSSSILTPKIKVAKVKTEEKKTLDEEKTDENKSISTNSGNNYIYPLSQVEIFVGYVSYSDYLLKGNGWYGQVTVRQSQKLSSSKPRKSMWGMGVLAGRYNTASKELEQQLHTFNTETKEIGGFISWARSTRRSNWNSIVMNFIGKQSVDEGSQENYSRKQVDILLAWSCWIDLARKKDNFFASRSNLSLYYQYPVKTTVSSFNNGERVSDEVWNKKMFIMNFDQTMLQFNLSEAVEEVSMSIGFNVGYRHFSQGKRDLYGLGAFTELFYHFSKVVRFGVEMIIDPHETTSRGKNIIYKADFDMFQVGRAIF